MINYDIFFRRNGVRLPQHLLAPHFPSLDNFVFPKDSIHHFTTMDNIITGPTTYEHLYREIEKKIFVYHVLEVTGDKGEPRKVALPLEPLVRDYHIRHKRYRRAIKLENIPRDENTLAVINYALLTKTSRYMKSMYAEYNKWWNLNKTIWDTAGKVASVSDRQQFIFLELPRVLPSVQRLNTYLNKVNPNFIEYFRDPNALMILELWKWLDPNTRAESILANISTEEMNKVNLIYQESGKLLVLNLGLLNSWIYSKGTTTEEQRTKLPPDKIRKCFLRMLMALMEYRTVDATVDPEMGVTEPNESDEGGEVLDGSLINTDKENSGSVVINNNEVHEPINNTDQQVTDNIESFEDRFKDIEKDLDQLDIIEKEQDIENSLEKNDVENQIINNSLNGGKTNIKDFDVDKTPDQVLKDICDKLADDGLMSGGEYRKYVEQIDKMATLPSPKDNVTMHDYVKIKQEDLLIQKPRQFKDRYNVIDKSMLGSSLELFDKNYIDKVLPKDIVSMPLALQKAGFVISKYDIETEEDILGASEVHVIKLNPIVGKASTIRIKIPKIQSNGEFKVGGTKYRMRKQRGDKKFLF